MAKRQSAGKRQRQVEQDERPVCAFGEPTGSNGKSPGYEGPGHCAACHDASEQSGKEFDAAVEAGDYNRQGYTLSDWTKAGKDAAEWADAPALEAPADDPAPIEEPPVHVVRCTDCKAGVRYKALPSRSGFTVLERYGVDPDQTFGIGTRGLPLCPFGHGEMELADDTLPVGEAMQQVAERLNGQAAAPTQAQLFEMAKPFNFEGAWMEIEAKELEISELSQVHKGHAATARESKKELDEAREMLDVLIKRFRERRLQKVKDAQQLADQAAGVTVDADVVLCGRITALGVPFDVASVAALTDRMGVESVLIDAEAHADERESWMPLLLEALGRDGATADDDAGGDDQPDAIDWDSDSATA